MSKTPQKRKPKPDPSEAEPATASEDVAGSERIYAFADDLAAVARDESAAPEERREPFVTFRLGKETFALPVDRVQEILKVTAITRVPHAPYPVRGVMNRRGGVLPVMDLRLRLGLEATEITSLSRVVVVLSKRRFVGLLVDSVQQVAQIAMTAVEAAPADTLNEHSDYVLGVYRLEEGLMILLDVERTLEIHEGDG